MTVRKSNMSSGVRKPESYAENSQNNSHDYNLFWTEFGAFGFLFKVSYQTRPTWWEIFLFFLCQLDHHKKLIVKLVHYSLIFIYSNNSKQTSF